MCGMFEKSEDVKATCQFCSEQFKTIEDLCKHIKICKRRKEGRRYDGITYIGGERKRRI